MSSTQSQEIEKLTKEIADLKTRINRIEDFLLDTFTQIDPRKYIIKAEDEEFLQAIDVVMKYETASASLLQRNMSIGYTKASRLLDLLEYGGYIGPASGIKPRKVHVGNLKEVSLVSDESKKLYDKAVSMVQQFNTASASFLQRKLSIGYARAARLIDMLEENGIVSRGEGAKPRDVLIKASRKKVKTKK